MCRHCSGSTAPVSELPDARGVRLGFLKDSAFSFYYPENLEVLESCRGGAHTALPFDRQCRAPGS